jgi:hypothetical protein
LIVDAADGMGNVRRALLGEKLGTLVCNNIGE